MSIAEGFWDKYLPNSNVVPKTKKAELLNTHMIYQKPWVP
jgi:hypothetical protein